MSDHISEVYEGNEPYLFISYSHKDYSSMVSIKRILEENNIRYWYDNGLHSGDDWNLVIAKHLNQASACLLLLSPDSAESEYVKNELNFAVNHKIPIHTLLLKQFVLPLDIEMMTGRKQMIKLQGDYQQKLIKSLPNEVFSTAASSNDAPPSPPFSFSNPGKKQKWLLAACCIAALFFASTLFGMMIARVSGSKNTSDNSQIHYPVATNSAADQAEPVHTHVWISATCTAPRTCNTCGETEGTSTDHRWEDATYNAPKTCTLCGVTEGLPLESPPQAESPPSLNIPWQGRIAAGNYHSVFLDSDGTVLATGSADLNDTNNKGSRLDVSSWTDIVEISASSHTVGLKSDGTVLACGPNQHGQCNVSSWSDIVSVRAGDNHTVGLRSDGTVVATGKNSHGQCDVSHWKNIVAIAVSENETYGLKDNGAIISAGRYTYGSAWRDIKSIAAATYDIYGIKADGTVVGAGSNSKWDSNTVSDWTNIVEISASSTHVVGLTANGTVVACGRGTAAEACAVEGWINIKQVCAGMNFTIGLTNDGKILSLGENRYGQCNWG